MHAVLILTSFLLFVYIYLLLPGTLIAASIVVH